MRLLNTRTGSFVSVGDPRTVHYAALSHVWSKEDSPNYVPEQTYRDVCHILANRRNISNPTTPGEYPNSGEVLVPGSAQSTSPSVDEESILPHLSDKLRRLCETAFADGFELAWADTCCIDHANPSELEEAITSMYDWYSYAKVCYVFLPDVSDRGRDAGSEELWETEFLQSQWFLRAWTLQELLAPNVVIFLSKNWQVLGSKHTLTPLIQETTAIDADVIRCQTPLAAVSVARRMSWAAGRQATREEDRAYSMLGIFGVNITIVYGEGSYAFYRLQEAIINEIPDQTIFAWQLPLHTPQNLLAGTWARPSEEHAPPPSTTSATASKGPADVYYPPQYLLANSPDDFEGSSDLVPLSREDFAEKLGVAPADAFQTFQPTPYGMSAPFPLVKVTPPSGSSIYLALLACQFGGSTGLVALILRPRHNVPALNTPARTEYVVGKDPATHSGGRSSSYDPARDSPDRLEYVRAAILSKSQCDRFLREFALVHVFIAHRPSRALHKMGHDASLYLKTFAATKETYRVEFYGWSLRLLEQQGYRYTTQPIRAVGHERPLHFVIAREGEVQHGLHLDVRVGSLSAHNPKALAVIIGCGNYMELTDCDSDSGGAHHYFSLISSWKQQRGAATKELGLVSLHGESLTLRLVVTHEPEDASRGAAGLGTPSAYRLGVEMFDIYSASMDTVGYSRAGPRR